MSNEAFLNRHQLAERWNCSVKKIDNDRLTGCGCRHVKIGRLVRYRLADVVEYEDTRLRRSTSDAVVKSGMATEFDGGSKS